MSKINSGILGGFSGKLGSVVGSRRNGKNIIQAQRIYTPPTIISNLLTNNEKMEVMQNQLEWYSKGIWFLINTLGGTEKLTRDELAKLNFMNVDLSDRYWLKAFQIRPLSQFPPITSTAAKVISNGNLTHGLIHGYTYQNFKGYNLRRATQYRSINNQLVGAGSSNPVNNITDSTSPNVETGPNYRLMVISRYNTALTIPSIMIITGRFPYTYV